MQIVSDPRLPPSAVLAEPPCPPAPAAALDPTGHHPVTTTPHGPDSPSHPEPARLGASDASAGNGESERLEIDSVVKTEQSPELESAAHSFGLSQSFPGTTGYLANRWNASTLSTPSMTRDNSR
jgi:hypothetical protein